MKIGIIGAGPVGTSLGKALLNAHHEVMFSSRDPQGAKAQAVRQETGAQMGTIQETLAFSAIIAIALPADALSQTIYEYAGTLAGRVIIDLNNRLSPVPPNSAGSVGQDIARITGGRVVKAFNTIGAEHYQHPVFEGQPATMFIASDDAEAKKLVMQFAADIGFDPIDAGGLEVSGLLENLARLWVHLATRAGLGRQIAFKLLQR